jgi:hypothetical protein
MRVLALIVAVGVVLCGCGDDTEDMGSSGGPDAGIAGVGDADSGDMGADDPGDGDGDGDAAAPPSGSDGPAYAADPVEPIPADCQGFELDGLMHSPGGEVLPNTCEPFHPTWNNPYAVLCIHAWPWYDTGFQGDELCILPPPADKGIQVGMHPQSPNYWAQMEAQDLSGYESPDESFVVEPGGEETRNFINPAGTDASGQYYRTYFRMRTGSHHNIVTLHPTGDETRWLASTGDALPGLFNSEAGEVIGTLGGQQRPDDNTPVSFGKPPEDEGMYLEWPDNPTVLYNMHHFNVTDAPILKEGWVNIWWVEDEPSNLVDWYMGLGFSQVATLAVQPGGVVDEHYMWEIDKDIRMVRVFGHRHVWTTNFSTWVERADGEVELIYQSFDWFDMPTYRYDSVVKNPSLNPEARIDGATSGVLELKAGDQLHFNCHMEFTDARAAAEGAPTPDEVGVLRFANEAYTGEMCILFGNNTGGDLGLPSSGNRDVPDFAK